MQKKVTTHYLEMTAADQLNGSPCPDTRLNREKLGQSVPALQLFFFMAVGLPFKWYSRLKWSYADWETYLKQPGVHTFIGYNKGTPFGYYELEKVRDAVEIKFFGLLPEYIGRGLGGWFLSRAVQDAWALDSKRVWVHTCSEDHPSALRNYLARGFREVRRETRLEALPEPDDPHTLAVNFWTSYLEKFGGTAASA